MNRLITLQKVTAAAEKANAIKIYGDGIVDPSGLPSFTCTGYSPHEVASLFQSFGFVRWAIGNGRAAVTHLVREIAIEGAD